MITVDIELESGISKERFQEIVEEIADGFPCGYVDYEYRVSSPIARDDSGHLLFQLSQSDITAEQEQYLSRREWVREYNTREGGIKDKPLDHATQATVRELLEPLNPSHATDLTTTFYLAEGLPILVKHNSIAGFPFQLQQINGEHVATIILLPEQSDTLLAILLQQKIHSAKHEEEDQQIEDHAIRSATIDNELRGR